MKRVFEWLGGFGLIAFSFYFTDQVSFLVASKSDLMNEIKSVSATYHEEAVNAVIDKEHNTIIPGKYGKKVDDRQSYFSMHEFGAFNENYLVFSYIKPNTSIENNKDKYIIRGNKLNRYVSFIIESDTIKKYFDKENIEYTAFANTPSDITNEKLEYINTADTKEKFKTLHSKLKTKNLLCLKDYSDLEMCLKHNYYILKPELILGSTNISEIKNNITSGSIIFVKEGALLEHIKILLNEINYKDLSIVLVSKLISEKE